MNTDQFCLRWNNFQMSMVSALENLQSTEDLVDVTLTTCEGKNIKAHKVILSACSPYFRGVFKENPCQHPVIILKDVNHGDMIALLQFMYQGEVLITQDRLSSFLRIADLLQIRGLAGSAPPVSQTQTVYQSAQTITAVESEIVKKSKTSSKIDHCSTDVQKEYDTDPLQSCSYDTTLDNSDRDVFVKSEIQDYDVCDMEYKQTTDDNLDNANSSESILERSLMQQSGLSPRSLKQCPPENVAFSPSSRDQPKSPSSDNVKTPCAALLVKHLKLPVEDIAHTDKRKHKLSPDLILNEKFKMCGDLAKSDCKKSKKIEMPLKSDGSSHSAQCGKCPHCGKMYSNQSALKYHVRLVHSDMTNMFCCHLCPESFGYRESYRVHMWESHGIRN